MDTNVTPKAPYFDTREAGAELAALVEKHGGADEARPGVLDRLKGLLKICPRRGRPPARRPTATAGAAPKASPPSRTR